MTNETYDTWAMIYRKTWNFRVVQFSRNFAVSIDRSGKIKIRKIFHIFGKISVEELVAIWITYSPAVRPVICSYLKTMSLQAILLEVNWSMTDPIYSVSRWLLFFCCCIWHCNCFIKMVSNDISVIAFMASWQFISRSVLPKSIIGRYITLRFTKIEMRSLWSQYTKKGHTYVTPSRSRYFMSLHYKWDMIYVLWYMIYIIPKVWLCRILIHVHHKITRGNAKHSTCNN